MTEASTYVSIDPGRPINTAWNRAIVGAYLLMPAIARALLPTPLREALQLVPSLLEANGILEEEARDLHKRAARGEVPFAGDARRPAPRWCVRAGLG